MVATTTRAALGCICKKQAWIRTWSVVGMVYVSCVSHPPVAGEQVGFKEVGEDSNRMQESSVESTPSKQSASVREQPETSASSTSSSSESPSDLSSAKSISPAQGQDSCIMDKMKFTRATSCNNDGSVEVCIPSDKRSHAKLLALVPELRCGSWRGRAACHPTREQNCIIPIDRSRCIDQQLSDEDWQRVCEVASLSFVAKVVPTFLE